MNDQRPNPDDLLKVIQKEEARQGRGKLKIFFGMAAGVGKTYAMLEAAHERKNEGVDVVVGYVETHKRPETERVLEGLEIVPRRKVLYRGTVLEEMDTDAILARTPQLVLVDELAHTNAPEVRHVKRYQDVLELLESGIDVYTTVNVQHFESRADAVRQITGIRVHETVPDSLIDLADQIELIDLSPDELRKRLREGKVYTPERVEVAADNFFRVGNLTALREMALRLTAERVDHQLQDYMQAKRIAGPWKSGERLIVAVGPSPFSERLIRWTRRVAYNLEAPWIAAYVQTPEPLTAEQNARLGENLKLARQLGGEVVITAAPRIEDGLIHLARQRNGTQIVVGKPQRSGFEEFLRGGTLVDKLIRSSGEIDVYVVTGDEDETGRRTVAQLLRPTQHSTWVQYLFAVAIIAGVTLLDYLVHPTLLSYQAVGLTELFAVLLIAVYIGRGPALLAAAVSAISWNFLFITPRFTFVVTELQDVILLLLYFVIALLTGNVTAKLRTQERQARQTADRTMALYALARSTATAVTMDDVLRTAIREIGQVFDADVAILLANGDQLERTPHPDSTLTIDEKDFSVAMWAFENGRPAGRHTDTLPGANARYLPLVTPSGTLGVIGVRRRIAQGVLEVEREVLLEALVNTVALVIERERLDEAAEQAAMLREAERLYTALLNSISHELRTPIATIAGASSSLMNPQTGAHEESRLALTSDIQDAAERLNNLVENLLDMSRLDSGHLTLKRDWTDVCDLIGVAVRRMQKRHTQHPISVDCPPDLPLVSLDFVLMEQVIVNLLDNACKYTPPGVAVRVNAAQEGDALLLRVTDAGQGLPPDDLERVFDKFYRVPGTATGGTGLGLSICRGLVEAHGGTLTAANVPDGGAQFTIRLMPGAPPPPVHEAQERG